ncbi:hypothetical protein SKAU_G00337920 [Synaphobranchus kaupii]|uniref:Uncharacterized protein n=1 Tax=Synaphobranchus kaupii TaxID=118154 RepID=A0A9Q1EME2_SYNKA|nr:hypothetical protein SKAU_G00337920 [Synaphobranchus kaupii]
MEQNSREGENKRPDPDITPAAWRPPPQLHPQLSAQEAVPTPGLAFISGKGMRQTQLTAERRHLLELHDQVHEAAGGALDHLGRSHWRPAAGPGWRSCSSRPATTDSAGLSGSSMSGSQPAEGMHVSMRLPREAQGNRRGNLGKGCILAPGTRERQGLPMKHSAGLPTPFWTCQSLASPRFIVTLSTLTNETAQKYLAQCDLNKYLREVLWC